MINLRVRLVIIKNNKLLVSFDSSRNHYFYIGGHVEFGETLEAACHREIKEECGEEVKFTFKEVLYIRDFIVTKDREHSLELFILGDIDKFEEVEGKLDDQFPGTHYQTWLDMEKLPHNLLPKGLTKKFLADYAADFPGQGEYLGEID